MKSPRKMSRSFSPNFATLRRRKKNPRRKKKRRKRKKRRRKKKKSNLLTHTSLSEPSAARIEALFPAQRCLYHQRRASHHTHLHTCTYGVRCTRTHLQSTCIRVA